MFLFFFSSRRRHTRFDCDWSSDVCSSDLGERTRKSKRQVVVPPSLIASIDRRRSRRIRPAPLPPRVENLKKRSEERREGKSVDLDGRRINKKKKYRNTHIRYRTHNTSSSE